MKLILIAGKKYPVKYGLSAISEVLTISGGSTLSDLSAIDQLPITKVSAFIMAGLKNGAKVSGDIKPPNIEEVEKELDHNFALFTDVIEIFGQDIAPKNDIDTEGNG